MRRYAKWEAPAVGMRRSAHWECPPCKLWLTKLCLQVHHYGNRISHTSFFKPRVLWALLYLISTVAGLCYVVQVPIFYQYPSIILIGYWVRYFSHQLGIYFLSLLLNNFKCCSKKEENENGKKKIKDEKLFEPQKQSFLERSLNKWNVTSKDWWTRCAASQKMPSRTTSQFVIVAR